MEDEEAAGQAIKFARQSGFKAVRAPSVSGLWLDRWKPAKSDKLA